MKSLMAKSYLVLKCMHQNNNKKLYSDYHFNQYIMLTKAKHPETVAFLQIITL